MIGLTFTAVAALLGTTVLLNHESSMPPSKTARGDLSIAAQIGGGEY
jgi:hypothetical protein